MARDQMTKTKSYDDVTKKIVAALKSVASQLGITAQEVTRTQLIKHGAVSDYSLRMVGGLDSVKQRFFPVSEKDLAGVRVGKEVKRKLSEMERKLGEKELFQEYMLRSVLETVKGLKLGKAQLPTVSKDKTKRSMTIELMLSDLHYGKKTKTFNHTVARNRMRHLTEVLLKEIRDKQLIFNVDRIIIALIGDIIESASMHLLESMVGSEFGNSEQVQVAIESLWHDVIVPVASLGIPIDVPAVTGNHDRSETKQTYHYPGKSNLTWIIYKTLEMLSVEAGFKNVKFHIAEDAYLVLPIYKENCLYEHGNYSKNTKDALENQMRKRSTQLNTMIHYIRQGHWHTYYNYERGRMIGNESLCGQDSFANVLGFDSKAGQTINMYIETKDRPTSFYTSFPVCLSHIGE